MAETLSLNLRGPGIPPTSFTYQKIESFSSPYQEVEWFSSPRSNPTGNGTPEMFRTKPPGSVFVFTVPLIGGAFGGIQRLIPLKKTDTVCLATLGREGSIECVSAPRRTKVLDVSQVGGMATLTLQFV